MTATVVERLNGAVVTRRGRTLHVVLSDGQELLVSTEMAAALAAALLADGQVHQAWLHGGGR